MHNGRYLPHFLVAEDEDEPQFTIERCQHQRPLQDLLHPRVRLGRRRHP